MQANVTLNALSRHESVGLVLVERLQQLINSIGNQPAVEGDAYEPSGDDHVRRPETLRKAGISKSKQCALVRSGQFPKPHHTGAIAWWYRWELDDWLKKDELPPPSSHDAEGEV